MSALAAIFNFDGRPVAHADVGAMLAAMASRAPDGASSWVEGAVGLGHGMLINTPEACHERQPLSAIDGRLHMVWDGRLDNRDEIRHELRLDGVSPRDATDPELVLQLYLLHREATPERLLGDFAFIIHDRTEQTLFFARDHVGARPLHYLLGERFVAVASADDALMPFLANGVRPNINRLVYAKLPLLDDFDWSEGWIDGLRMLLPGTHMSVNLQCKVRRRQYWQFRVAQEDSRLVGQASVEAFASVLERSTRDRLRVAAPTGMLLSGGIDSACVAAAASRQTTPVTRVCAYSVVSDVGVSCIESQAIRTMLAVLGWDNRQILVPSFSGPIGRRQVADLAWDRPHPVNNSILLVAALCRLAQRDGIRVLLNGVSGDLSFFSPQDYFVHVACRTGLRRAFAELRQAQRRHVYLHGCSTAWLLSRAAWDHLVPLAVKRMRPTRRFHATTMARNAGLDADVVGSLRIVERIEAAWARNDRLQRMSPAEQHQQVLAIPGLVRGLEGYDRVGGDAGIEMRDPLADLRVLEWLQRVPLDGRVQSGRTKWVGREYVHGIFGSPVAWRNDKEHLGGHFIEAAMADWWQRGHLAEVSERLLSDGGGPGVDGFESLTLKHWRSDCLTPRSSRR